MMHGKRPPRDGAVRYAAGERRVTFDAEGRVERIGSGARLIEPGSLIALLIEDVRIDTSRFRSSDWGRRREGVLRIRVGQQDTLLPFSGRAAVASPDRDKIAFVGVHPGALALSLELTELDEDVRKALGQVERWAKLLARLPPASLHPALPAGMGLVESVAGLIRAQVEDDVEAQVLWIHDEALRHGDLIRASFRTSDAEDGADVFRVDLRVEDLGTPSRGGRLVIRVNEPRLTLSGEIERRARTRREELRGIRPRGGSAEERLAGEGLDRFNFEARSGRARWGYSARLASTFERVAWQKTELFRVPAPRAASRHLVPLTATAALNPDGWNAELWLDVFERGFGLAEDLGSDDAGIVARNLRKHGPSILSAVSELTDESLSLLSFDGVLVLLPPGAAEGFAMDRGRILLPWDPEVMSWKGTIARDLDWEKQGLGRGRFTFELEVKPV